MTVDTTYLYVHLFRLFPQGCKQQFHVTCAQGLGLLCEEAGNYLDNVKYCGYCQHHYSKLVSSNIYVLQMIQYKFQMYQHVLQHLSIYL